MIVELPPTLKPLAQLLDEPRPNVVVVVGTGVTVGATGDPRASWKGLLLDGLERIGTLGTASPEWLGASRVMIEDAFSVPFVLDEVLQRAETIVRCLGGVHDPRYAAWLKESAGTLRIDPNRRQTLDAIADIVRAGALVLTTNYDSLLSEATGLDPVTWQQHDKILEIINRQARGVIHVHGHWREPASVVLDRTSYDRVRGASVVQAELRSLWLNWTWLYLGCGSGGLDDPNLGALLRWGREAGLGESALQDHFLANQATIDLLPDGLGKSSRLIKTAYQGHGELPALLRGLTPEVRCSPFERMGPSARRVRGPNESALSSPFPSWQEYLDGFVPEVAADQEVVRRLRDHGWAFVLDVASVGKTTLAYRIAAHPEFRDVPAYHLLLSNLLTEDGGEGASPQAALARLARPGVLLVVDDAHQNQELAHAIWQQWLERPLGSKLLLLGTRISTLVTPPGGSSLLSLETHAANPAIQLCPDPEDLGRIALCVMQRLDDSLRELKIPAEITRQWHKSFGAELGAFVVAVTQRRRELATGWFELPETAAAAWMQERHLQRLAADDIENVVCLATFGEQDLELAVPEQALPHPARIGVLLRSALAERLVTADGRYIRYALREPGWGRLILAAIETPADRSRVLLESAAKDVVFAYAIHVRLKSSGPKELGALWLELVKRVDQLCGVFRDAPLANQVNFLRVVAQQHKASPLVDALWHELAAGARFKDIVWRTPLATLSYLTGLARSQGRVGIAEQVWTTLEECQERLGDRALTSSLRSLNIFMNAACEYRKRGLVDAILFSLAKSLNALVDLLLVSALQDVARFLEIVEDRGKQELRDALWLALAARSERLGERATTSSLQDLGSFFVTLENHGKRELAEMLWKTLAAHLESLVERATTSSLQDLGNFFVTLENHGKRELAEMLWKTLTAHPESLVERATTSSLQDLGSFFVTLENHGKQELAEMLRKTLAAHLESLVERATTSSLQELGSFLVTLENHGKRELAEMLWKTLAAHPESLVERATTSSLQELGGFLVSLENHGKRELAEMLWKTLAADPELLVERVLATSLGELGGLLEITQQRGALFLVEAVRGALRAEPERFATWASSHTPSQLMSFLVRAPEDIRKAVVQRFRVEDWSWSAFRNEHFSTGAAGLAATFAANGRADLKGALVENILSRKNPSDFVETTSALVEMSRLLALTTADQGDALSALLDTVCTDRWLHDAYRDASLFGIAGALQKIAIYQPPAIIRRFWHPWLSVRLANALALEALVDDGSVSAAVQLLGASQLVGWSDSRINSTLLPRISSVRLKVLPSLVPHRADALVVQAWQRQLWLGLRAMASITRQYVIIQPEEIRKTLDLWKKNIEGSGDWPGTLSQPHSTAHRINVSMVGWLDRCVKNGAGQLLPDPEPLWTLVGFSRTPRLA